MASGTGTDADMEHLSSPRGRKRSRYTRHACQRCQKAKVRCDGRLPCAYCAVREGECHYTVQAPPNFQVHVPQLQDDQNTFQAEVAALLREQNEKLDLLIKKTATMEATYDVAGKGDASTAVAVLPSRKQPLPLFQTSTSAFFCVNVVKMGIQRLGPGISPEQELPIAEPSAKTRSALSIIHGEVINGESSDISPSELGEFADAALDGGTEARRGTSHPKVAKCLNELECDLVLQAVQAFADMEFPMYPILDMADIMRKAKDCGRPTTCEGSARGRHPPEVRDIGKDDLSILKMVVALGLLAEGETHRKLAATLFESLRPQVEAMVWSAAVDLKDLILMTLVTLFHFHCGRWRLAWRFQGNVSRIILELGLNRKVVLDRSFPDIKSRVQAINTTWTIFVLEQHLSYALGFSNAMPNLRLESNFPPPVDAPFLTLMIDYASIGRHSCDALLSDKVLSPEQATTWQEDYDYFRYRVSLWAIRATESFTDGSSSPGIQMVRTILYLRANHLRTLVARAFLCSGLRQAAPLDIWTIVDIAADTIQVLTQLDSNKREYRFHEAQMNHFLVTALDILVFATTHKTSGVESPSANGEALSIPPETAQKAQKASKLALNRLRGLAECSTQTEYLWDRVQMMASRLNLAECLFSKTSKEPASIPAQTPSGPPFFADAPVRAVLGMDQSATAAVAHESGFDSEFFALQSGETTPWGFQMPSSAGLDFDFTQDFSTLLNTSWMS
ncbi:hypothetical protein PV04_01512 [Phialophora macrospora]|uniref:Zn(2)-C6 fungal-type domain-containing protein n=1 Tax=Phialophora macrospora TaxID=1851006 RepID=A0A0D2G3L0_9EURO|nr:hypothetical protein PV04_01512 [Phialophora macrospora]